MDYEPGHKWDQSSRNIWFEQILSVLSHMPHFLHQQSVYPAWSLLITISNIHIVKHCLGGSGSYFEFPRFQLEYIWEVHSSLMRGGVTRIWGLTSLVLMQASPLPGFIKISGFILCYSIFGRSSWVGRGKPWGFRTTSSLVQCWEGDNHHRGSPSASCYLFGWTLGVGATLTHQPWSSSLK